MIKQKFNVFDYSYEFTNDLNINAPDNIDFIVVIGGDGSMLRSIHRFVNLDVPFFGIHDGSIGFLMNHFDSNSLIRYFSSLENNLSLTELPLLDIKYKVANNDNVYSDIALNDLYLIKSTAQAVKLEISIQKDQQQSILKTISDGLIISTPIGSSGYNCSAGGPLISFDVNAFIVSPICSSFPKHWKGGVIKNDSIITIKCLESDRRPILLCKDGVNIDHGQVREIIIKEHDSKTVKILTYKDDNLLKKSFTSIMS